MLTLIVGIVSFLLGAPAGIYAFLYVLDRNAKRARKEQGIPSVEGVATFSTILEDDSYASLVTKHAILRERLKETDRKLQRTKPEFTSVGHYGDDYAHLN